MLKWCSEIKACVSVENCLGKITVKALVTPIIHPDIVMAEHGWWFPAQGMSRSCR